MGGVLRDHRGHHGGDRRIGGCDLVRCLRCVSLRREGGRKRGINREGRGKEECGGRRHTIHSVKLLESSRPLEISWVATGICAAIRDFRVDFSVGHAWVHRVVGELDYEVDSTTFYVSLCLLGSRSIRKQEKCGSYRRIKSSTISSSILLSSDSPPRLLSAPNLISSFLL